MIPVKLVTYVEYHIENRQTLRNVARILGIFGVLVMIYSLVSFTLFAKGISVLKFLFLFLSAFALVIGGLVLFYKANEIANRSIRERGWHNFVVACPVVVAIIVIVVIEELYNCTQCVIASLIFLIVCILFALALLLLAHSCKQWNLKKPLEQQDIDRYTNFQTATFIGNENDHDSARSKLQTKEQLQEAIETRLQNLSDQEFETKFQIDDDETNILLQTLETEMIASDHHDNIVSVQRKRQDKDEENSNEEDEYELTNQDVDSFFEEKKISKHSENF